MKLGNVHKQFLTKKYLKDEFNLIQDIKIY